MSSHRPTAPRCRPALLRAALAVPLLLLYWAADRGHAGEARTLRVYFVGNSVTDTVKYGLLAKLAESRGRQMPWGRHMIPGAPLFGMLHHGLDAREGKIEKAGGFTEKPYGDCVQALSGYEWDAVSLQPFDRRLVFDGDESNEARPQGDVRVVQRFLDLALGRSPDVQVYLYARWPRCYKDGKGVSYDKEAFDRDVRGAGKAPRDEAAKAAVDDYDVAWNTPYTGGWGAQLESRDYFERLLQEVRARNPRMKKPVLLIPVGYVMAELNRMMKAGEVPGYGDIHGVYADGIHLDNVGAYLTACTFYAAIFHENPEGLPSEVYGVTDKALAAVIEKTAWRVVAEHPFSGVAAR